MKRVLLALIRFYRRYLAPVYLLNLLGIWP